MFEQRNFPRITRDKAQETTTQSLAESTFTVDESHRDKFNQSMSNMIKTDQDSDYFPDLNAFRDRNMSLSTLKAPKIDKTGN